MSFFQNCPDFDKPLKALDLGVGTGLISQELKKINPLADITGIDFSQEMIDRTEEKQVIDQSYCIDVSNTPIPMEKEHFDITYAGALFEYIEEPSLLLSELCRVTKQGGRIAFTTQASRHYIDRILRKGNQIYKNAMGKNPSGSQSIIEYYHSSQDIIDMLHVGGMIDIEQETFVAYAHKGPVEYHFFTARKGP